MGQKFAHSYEMSYTKFSKMWVLKLKQKRKYFPNYKKIQFVKNSIEVGPRGLTENMLSTSTTGAIITSQLCVKEEENEWDYIYFTYIYIQWASWICSRILQVFIKKYTTSLPLWYPIRVFIEFYNSIRTMQSLL